MRLRRSGNAVIAIATLALAIVGAGSSVVSAQSGAPGSLAITGAGATFPFPLYSRWFYDYAFIDPAVRFNYQSIGSGGGIKQITEKTVDFGASDAILTADQLAAAPGIQMFPTVAGGDVVTYNVSELAGQDPIVLDGPTTADIFLGKITKWNDPAIANLNPGRNLPDKDIVVVHRSDGSGTTFIFTSYLSAVSDEWKTNVGASASVEWPVGLGGKGNEGVSGTLSQTDGAIGYVELAYATQNNLAVANMANAAGNTVAPSIDTITSAMADYGSEMPDTLARLIVNAPGAQSWPIAGYTYMLLYMDQTDCAKARSIVDFLHWALTEGSADATALEYVPLPSSATAPGSSEGPGSSPAALSVRDQVFARLDQVTCNGAPLK